MTWTRIIFFNFILTILFLVFLEIGAGFGRLIIGKPFWFPEFFQSNQVKNLHYHPCVEMQTDVLLTHVPYTRGLCKPKGGEVMGEYVVYNTSTKTNPVLLTLGGSTTSGFYQHFSEGETFPKFLAELSKEQFFLINGGVGGYSSLQELYKFIRDGSRVKNLELVISLNGVNELPSYFGPNSERRLLYPYLTDIQHDINQSQSWIDQRVSGNYFNKIAPNTFSFFNFIVNRNKPSNNQPIYHPEDPIFSAVDAADRWEKNVSRINKLVLLEGARYYIFLQPTMGLEGPQSQPLKNSNDAKLLETLSKDYIEEIRTLYSDLKSRCSKLEFCYDISDAVPPSGDVYNDPRHHNADGNEKLANAIWKIVSDDRI
jgi:hypothetical protein